MDRLIIDGIDVSHSRLVELTKLADQAKSFYDWVEEQFQRQLGNPGSLHDIISIATIEELRSGLRACYFPATTVDLPVLSDGIGRSYPHIKGCYYFFSWLIRDAPQQRLAPLLQRIKRSSSQSRVEIEIFVLSALIHKYRANVKTFTWAAIREVIVDRLEGSRRSLRGHEKEAIVRTALFAAIQSYFDGFGNYGKFAGVEISDRQIVVGGESFDVSAVLFGEVGQPVQRILVPIKTRETEGGGHSRLFTRDVRLAIEAAKFDSPNDFLIVVIVARNWSEREAEILRQTVDHVILFDVSPNEFTEFDDTEQVRLNQFLADLLTGSVVPKQFAGG
jgi:hypothetical protein